MLRRYYPLTIVLVLFAVLILEITLLSASHANARPSQQYPIMDKVANKIITKYQNSTCNDLYQQKSQKAPPTPEEQKAIAFLHNDPQMRAAFINKVAAPIANKLFECGLIP